MPRPMKRANNASNTSNKKTAEEIRQIDYEQGRIFAEQAKDDLKQLTDYTKSNIKTISTFNKEDLNTYLKNIGSYQTQLRNLSWYMYYRSMTYRRVINYYANMFCLNARQVTANMDLQKSGNASKAEKSYYDTIQMLDVMNLQLEFLKVYLNNFVQDVFYGVAYLDETGFFILPLPPDYCKIAGYWNDGGFYFVMDMTYFRGQREYLVELLGYPFDEMYRAYGGNNVERWQPVPRDACVCTKYSIEDWEINVPPFSGAFMDLVGLEDLKDFQAVADAQEIYKLIYYKLGTLSGAKDSNRFKVSTDLAIDYFNRFIDDAIPSYTSAGMVLGDDDLGVIDFSSSDKVNDTTKVTKATKEVLNTMGGSQVLNGATITGAEAMKIAQRVDTEFAISSLLPQTELIVNRLLRERISDAAKVEFFPISVYTRDDFRDALLLGAQNGLSQNIIALNVLYGISERSTINSLKFANDVLHIQDMLRPLATSYTQSGEGDTDPVTGGRPTENGEATDEADASR